MNMEEIKILRKPKKIARLDDVYRNREELLKEMSLTEVIIMTSIQLVGLILTGAALAGSMLLLVTFLKYLGI